MEAIQQSPTGDNAELARFNALAKMWWNDQGPMWALHAMNRFRIQVILDVLAEQGRIERQASQPLAGMKVLDIGCGGGILSETLARLGAKVTGVDLAERNIRIAQEHATSQGLEIDYRYQDVTTLDGHFDLIFNMEVVEHVADLPTFMQACYRNLKPGGMTFVSTINRTPLSYLLAIVGAEYVLRLLPKGTHQWRKFVSPGTMEQLLDDAGLKPCWQSGVRFNPFRRHFALQKSRAVSYMLAAIKNTA